MTQVAVYTGAPPAREGGALGFLREAVANLKRRSLIVPAVVLTLVLTGSNILILLNMPARGELPSGAAIAGILLRLVGLWILAVATCAS